MANIILKGFGADQRIITKGYGNGSGGPVYGTTLGVVGRTAVADSVGRTGAVDDVRRRGSADGFGLSGGRG